MTPEEILDQLGDGLREALRPESPLNLHTKPDWSHGFYGFERHPNGEFVDDWFGFAGEIGRALQPIGGYTFLDLGCCVGGKCPFFTAWGCAEYLGVEQIWEGVEFATRRWGNSFVSFRRLDVVKDPWPRGYDAMGMTYVFQHVGLSAKRAILAKVREHSPKVFILADRCLRDGTLADCAGEHSGNWRGSKQVPFPLSELKASLPDHDMARPFENLFIFRRRE